MLVRTEVRRSSVARLSGAKWSVKAKWRLVLGRVHLALEDGRQFLDASRASENVKQAGRLTEARIAALTAFQSNKVGGDARKRSRLAITDASLVDPKEMQHKGCRLLKEFLDANPAIGSVANIGARVDVVSSYLAPRFPDVEFVSVDLQPDLADHNRDLPKSDNWTFLSGYAHDLLASGKLKADAVFMTSTACLLNNVELNLLFELMRCAGVKHVIINEPWWHAMKSFSLALPLPENVPIDAPYVSGSNAHYHPNYGAKIERAGYRVIASRLIDGPQPEFCCLQIIASC